MIIQTQKQIFNIMASNNANWFIFYFKRLPLVGNILPDSIYGNISLKKKVAVIALFLRALGKLIGKVIFVGLLTILPAVLIEKNPSIRLNSYIHIFLMLNLFGPFMTSSILNADRNKFVCIRLMHVDAKNYTVSTVLFQVFTDFLYFLPTVLLSTIWMDGSALQGIILLLSLTAFNLIGEAFFLMFYTRTGIMLSKKTLNFVIVGIIMLAAAYLPVFLHSPLPPNILLNPVLPLALIALGALSIFVIIKSEKYSEIAAAILKASAFSDANQKIARAAYADVAVREKEFSETELNSNKYENQSGFTYLNSIFFERHRRLMVKPILIRLAIIAVLFVAAIIVSLFEPEFIKPLKNSGSILPVFVFIMYFASIGERVCKAMFYNCDISLLRYQFYRDKKAVLSNFKARLFRVAELNLIVAAAISAAVVGLVMIFKLNWATLDTISFVLSILVLSLFFSVHHLFLYYVFQPYTTEAGLKNPFYSVINWGVYFVCYFCMKIKSPPSYFTLIVLASTLIYIAVALLLVYKYAPKNFRVK